MPEALLAGICLAMLLAHIASTAVAMFRFRPQRQLMPPPAAPPKVAVLRPVGTRLVVRISRRNRYGKVMRRSLAHRA